MRELNCFMFVNKNSCFTAFSSALTSISSPFLDITVPISLTKGMENLKIASAKTTHSPRSRLKWKILCLIHTNDDE